MQLMIDTAAESPAALRIAAEFLTSHAALRDAMEGTSEVPTGTPAAAPFAPAAPTAPIVAVAANSTPAAPSPTIPVVDSSIATASSNVVPFVPPAPMTNANVAGTPATVSTPTALSNLATASPAASVAPPAPDEFDAHGVPYDARIHQSGKSQKKDGSWKLKKGIDEGMVAAVLQELAPRIRKPAPEAPPAPTTDPAAVFGQTPQTAGASPAPVSLPPVPPPPGAQDNVAPPAPAAPAEAVAPAADPFRTLVAKVTKARGEKRLTAEEVTQCCLQAGCPTFQSLSAMPHLVSTVEANIDVLLATR